MSNIKLKNNPELVAAIEAALNAGDSVRGVAKDILGAETRESTIRAAIKRGDITLGTESDVDDTLSEDFEDLDELCNHEDWDLSSLAKRLRTAQKNNNHLRKLQRELFDGKVIDFSEVMDKYRQLQPIPNKHIKLRPTSVDGKGLVMEVLFNDWQVAKRMSYYNTEIAISRVEEYTKQILKAFHFKIEQGYTFDKIVVVFNGDIIEADKHDDSILASDRSPAEQLAIAMQVLSEKFLTPIAELGVSTDVIMLTGNHDWNGRGMMAYEAGKHQLSYPMYRAIEMLMETKGYSHLKCTIPSGWYYVHEFLGKNVLYEHGVGVASSEAAMRKRMQQRGQQLEKHIHYIRLADKHHSQRHHNDTVVLAGAFFGRCDDDGTGSEYSASAGYAADPSQLVFFHQKRGVNDYRNTIIDSLEVQLGHINHLTVASSNE